MFNSTVLDLVILLSFTYFIGSLLISSLQEIIATALNWRAKDLESTLNNLLFDKEWQPFLNNKVLNSPFIAVLRKDVGKFPSYIPPANFARAVMEPLGGSDLNKIAATLSAAPAFLPGDLKTAMDDFLLQAGGDVKAFQSQLETFYNTGMDRATGWYKRRVRKLIFWMSLLVAILLNLDTIKIVNDSLKQPAQLKANADQIASAMKDIQYKEDSTGISVRLPGKGSAELKVDTAASKASLETLSTKIKALNTLTSQLKAAGLKIGYDNWNAAEDEWAGNDPAAYTTFWWANILIKLAGCFITVFALQLGSGYWFGILTKAINIRGTGKKPGEKQSK